MNKFPSIFLGFSNRAESRWIFFFPRDGARVVIDIVTDNIVVKKQILQKHIAKSNLVARA